MGGARCVGCQLDGLRAEAAEDRVGERRGVGVARQVVLHVVPAGGTRDAAGVMERTWVW